ncbi:MAG: hypothetical protein Q7R51_01115 [bacterium]|nr:hypothetical protein [bacterium]
MDPNIRNFSKIEELIRKNPGAADEQAFKWEQFLKNNAEASPELYSMETADEFTKWADAHPEKNIDTSVWIGKEIADSYYYLRDQHEDLQMQENGGIDRSIIPQDLISMPLLASAFLIKPRIMQEDRDYERIKERLESEWLRNNKAKDFSSKEGVDYLYGSLDDSAKTSIHADAERVFRENPKFKNRVDRYDREKKRIYKNHENDPTWQLHQHNMQEEVNARLELLEKNRPTKLIKLSKEDIKKSQNELIERINKKYQGEFTQTHPEKAKVYFERIETRKTPQLNIKAPSAQISFTPTQITSPSIPSVPRTSGAPTGRIGRGINFLNKLAGRGLPNPLGGAGSKLASRGIAKLGASFFASPSGIALLLMIGLFITVVVFVMVFPPGNSEQSSQTNVLRINTTPTPPAAL